MRNKKEKSKQKKASYEKELSAKIRCYGDSVLHSDVFRRAGDETHHLHGSVSDHTLNVCITSTRISRFLQKKGIHIKEKDLIRASLCHDLGMVERRRKFRSRKASWKLHPEESVRIAHTIFPDLSADTENIIRSHMWPVYGKHPCSREALILNLADKYASAVDWISWVTGKKYKEKIKKRLSDD